MFTILPPEKKHAAGLVQLSNQFAQESSWACRIPLGQISTPQAASERLFGQDVLAALVAETDTGEMAGYIGIYEHPDGNYCVYLVAAAHRRQGLARLLVESAFSLLSPGLEVEAWIGELNTISLDMAPKLGFTIERTIEEDGKHVHIFTRSTD
jgi:RimJ/RimL family protein N-acetyltransferase